MKQESLEIELFKDVTIPDLKEKEKKKDKDDDKKQGKMVL